ncbi:MAG: GTP-binding protein [Candidatus Kariarchaeaceae archaeon]
MKDIFSTHSNSYHVNFETFTGIKNEIFRLILENDVNFNLATGIMDEIEDSLYPTKSKNTMISMDSIVKGVYGLLEQRLGKKYYTDQVIDELSRTILFVGFDGRGKTKFIAKIAKLYANEGYKVGILDISEKTYIWPEVSNDHNIEILRCENKHPSRREVKKKLKLLRENGNNLILIESRGSKMSDKNFAKLTRSIRNWAKPDDTWLVLDGTVGQSNYHVLGFFKQEIQVSGCLISKVDLLNSKLLVNLILVNHHEIQINYLGYGEEMSEIVIYDPLNLLYDVQ